MGKVDYRRLSEEKRKNHFDLLMQTLKECGLSDEGQEFLRDLLMESEVTMFARRIEIARLLIHGLSFEDIRKKLRAGLMTIITIDRWLSAKMYGYRSILRAHKRSRRRGPPPEWGSLRWLAEKYPSRALLIHLLLGDELGS